MAFTEYSTVRLIRALTADDGRALPTGTIGTIVHIWDQDSVPAAYEVEVMIDDPINADGSWHLTTAQPDDIELVEPPKAP